MSVGYSVDLMTSLQNLLSSREVSSDKTGSAEIIWEVVNEKSE